MHTRPPAAVVATSFNVVVTGLAGAGPPSRVQTGAVSDAVPAPITPAGWAFSVWSVVFAGAVAFAV